MFALLAFGAIAPVLYGPKLPPGTRHEFQVEMLAVTDALEMGDFASAKASLSHLPTAAVKIEWDDHTVDSAQRGLLRAERDRALEEWRAVQIRITPTFVSHGADVRFSFVKELPVSSETGVRAGAALHFGDAPNKPALEVVIALTRGEPGAPTKSIEVFNEVARGLGAYYGLADSPFVGTFMSRTDLPTDRENVVTGLEGNMVGAHLRAIVEVADRVAKSQRVKSARPKAVVEPLELDGGIAVQGEGSEFQIQLTNVGNSPLTYRVIPDCQCLLLAPGGDVAPGAKYLIRGRMDTSNGVGPVQHRLLLMTNDIDQPNRIVPFKVVVKPRFRFLSDAPEVLLAPKGPLVIHAYLFSSGDQPIGATASRLSGITGKVESIPWEGSLADPAMKEGPLMRHGTKFTIHLDTSDLVGRRVFTLLADTDDAKFKTVQLFQTIQKGIAALPAEVYFGEVVSGQVSSLLLTRPGKPFKVISHTFDSPFFRLMGVKGLPSGDLQVDLQYAGGASRGPLNAVLTVQTDDPDQPVLKVPLQAVVR